MSIDRKPLLICRVFVDYSDGPNLVVPWRQGITHGDLTEASLGQSRIKGCVALAGSRAKPRRPITNQS
jgi:hypothetical protein